MGNGSLSKLFGIKSRQPDDGASDSESDGRQQKQVRMSDPLTAPAQKADEQRVPRQKVPERPKGDDRCSSTSETKNPQQGSSWVSNSLPVHDEQKIAGRRKSDESRCSTSVARFHRVLETPADKDEDDVFKSPSPQEKLTRSDLGESTNFPSSLGLTPDDRKTAVPDPANYCPACRLKAQRMPENQQQSDEADHPGPSTR